MIPIKILLNMIGPLLGILSTFLIPILFVAGAVILLETLGVPIFTPLWDVIVDVLDSMIREVVPW